MNIFETEVERLYADNDVTITIVEDKNLIRRFNLTIEDISLDEYSMDLREIVGRIPTSYRTEEMPFQ